jgi:phage-related protein
MSGGPLASTMSASAKAAAEAKNKGLKTEEDYANNIKKTREEIKNAEKKGTAGAAEQAAMRAKYQGQLMDRLNAALARLFPIVVKVVEAFVQLFTFGVTFAEKVLIPAFKDLFGNISVKDITQPFVDFFDGLFGTGGGELDFKSIKEGIVNFIAPIRDFVGNIVKSIDFKAVGTALRETFVSIKNFVMGMWESFSTSMGGGQGMMETFKSIWTSVKEVVLGIVDSISYVVKLFLASPLFETLKKMFGLVVKIIVDLVDVVVAIVKSPLGTFLINALMDVFGFFGDVINSILEAVDGIIEIVSGVFKILTGDFKGGWEKIKGGVLSILKSVVDFFISIPKLIFNVFKDGIVGIIDSLKGIITSVIDGIKALASGIVSFFGSKKDEAKSNAEPPKQNPAVTAAASSQSQATKTADQYAKDVYDKKMDIAKVPADMQAKVSEILKNPPASWKQAVNQTQQTNNQQKPPEQPAANTQEKKPEPKKDTTPPPTDLNNKDALGILKTIADYQYKTISAVKDLNGNLLKR